MPEEKVDVVEETSQEEVLDGKVETDQEESSTSEKVSQEKAGEAGKTKDDGGSAEVVEPDDLAGLEEGQTIPYGRFKKVIDGRNKLRGDHKTLSVELEEARGYINNPDVFRAILLSKGITDKKVQNEKLKEAGFEVKEETKEGEVYKDITQGLDLNTQDGWLKAMERAVKTFGKELVEPVHKKLSEREANEWITKQESEAKKLSKETFNLEYGQVGKDEGNPNTGVGKIWAYIQKHPEHARLGHVALLRLSLSEEGYKLGKQEGLNEARKNNETLKEGQVEDDSGQIQDNEPSADASVSDIMSWRRRHPNK